MAIQFIYPNWKPFTGYIALTAGTVCIFKLDIENYYNKISSLSAAALTATELEKSTRYIREADRKRYIAGKYFLRQILSKITKTPARELQFRYTDNKKPYIPGLEFNITHSGNYILLAISTNAVGVDIEHINPNFKYDDLLNSNFSTDEIEFLNNSKDRNIAFYTIWTRKEALLKATGEGLDDDLSTVYCMNEKVQRNNVMYNLSSFRLDESYIAALAVDLKHIATTYTYYEYQ